MRLKQACLLVALLLLVNGCGDFLDDVPDNRVDLNNLDKAAQLLTNAYSTASPAFTDWMTDDVTYTVGTIKRPEHDKIFAWEDDNTSSPTIQDTPIFFWSETYNAIAHSNEVLAVLEELPAPSVEDQARKQAIEAEALLTRAYGHFMLVNMFGKHYNEETSGSDLGVPYIVAPETTFLATYKRNTVQEVYDLVEQDMLRGIELVDDSFYANSGKYHFTKNAALAFASRYYLYKGDHEKCFDYSTQLLGSDPSVFVRDLTADEYQGANISSFPQIYSSPDEQANLMLMRKISLVQRTDFAFGVETNFYFDLFSTQSPFGNFADQRENAIVKGQDGALPNRYESLFERSSLNSNVGTPYHIALSFRGEEVLLNRAESAVFLNRVDDAMADLQAFVNKRYIPDNPADLQLTIEFIRNHLGVGTNPGVSDRFALFLYILEERRKEFIIQGLRWFDIKRLGIEVEHTSPGSGTQTLEVDDLRLAIQIPETAVDVGDMEPNPR
ncbi:MAG: RagB/SusD family nutrient uptake outer membrane protein [Cyclobacteriaceae bacterium]